MELVVEDAAFVTMAAEAGPADGMLIRDGRIAEIGPAEAVRAAAPGADVVRLGGATVIPGLIDAHCHVADVGYLAAAADCSQPAAPDIAAIQARLREAADRTPEGSWVTGGGYAEYKLREARHPTRAELDQAVPGRPAVLYHTSLHACVLNTAALREAGFADGQPDPQGGAFGRDSQGRLDGVVYEAPMFALFEQNLRRDIARMGAGADGGLIQAAGQRLAAFGLTAACDADMRRDTFAAFAEADAGGLLSQRIYGLIVHNQVGAVRQGRHSSRLATEAVKIWADGGMSSRTAAIHGTYPVPPHGSGILYFERDELIEMVRSRRNPSRSRASASWPPSSAEPPSTRPETSSPAADSRAFPDSWKRHLTGLTQSRYRGTRVCFLPDIRPRCRPAIVGVHILRRRYSGGPDEYRIGSCCYLAGHRRYRRRAARRFQGIYRVQQRKYDRGDNSGRPAQLHGREP